MLTVNDLMTVAPYCVTPQTLLIDAHRLLQDEEIRQVPVVAGESAIGILTERDIKTMRNDDRFANATVEAAMTPNPVTVTPETPAFRAAEMLRTYKFGALPVVDKGRLVGIVTVSDFLSRMAAESAPPSTRPVYESSLSVGSRF